MREAWGTVRPPMLPGYHPCSREAVGTVRIPLHLAATSLLSRCSSCAAVHPGCSPIHPAPYIQPHTSRCTPNAAPLVPSCASRYWASAPSAASIDRRPPPTSPNPLAATPHPSRRATRAPVRRAARAARSTAAAARAVSKACLPPREPSTRCPWRGAGACRRHGRPRAGRRRPGCRPRPRASPCCPPTAS